ncbi:MAG: bifunctional pyr operon transcriptional regulator/uracil phosphoribosyltransferase PyrR [Desulfobacterales bacterium]|jgi:pyrimidine operon attenuation protein/uracil phosphoribosyltransferase|nr:bifunctional pyr operon transcriptional regulator/uracil phosphoribosyltransferase PyrR [Desulfobacterales bacterium]
MSRKKKVIMTAQDIERALARIALQILERNLHTEEIVIVGIHTGGVFLADRIHSIIKKREKVSLPSGSLDITLYRDDWSRVTQNPIVKKTDIPFEIEGKTLVLVDDVLYTGRTIRAALDAIMDFGRPSSIQLAVLMDRGGRELPIQADYTGMEIQVEPNQHIHVLLHENADIDEVVLDQSN